MFIILMFTCICRRLYCHSFLNVLVKNETLRCRRYMATLVVGLGNYFLSNTRHNIGMMAVDSLAERLQTTWKYNRKCYGEVATCKINYGKSIILLKPRLVMNNNGKSIRKTAKLFEVNSDDIILLHDDLDRPLGKISMKHGGSASGHNGVKSVIHYLGSDIFKRLRIGIGRPVKVHQVIQYVLEEFKEEEMNLVQQSINKTVDIVYSELSTPSVS